MRSRLVSSPSASPVSQSTTSSCSEASFRSSSKRKCGRLGLSSCCLRSILLCRPTSTWTNPRTRKLSSYSTTSRRTTGLRTTSSRIGPRGRTTRTGAVSSTSASSSSRSSSSSQRRHRCPSMKFSAVKRATHPLSKPNRSNNRNNKSNSSQLAGDRSTLQRPETHQLKTSPRHLSIRTIAGRCLQEMTRSNR